MTQSEAFHRLMTQDLTVMNQHRANPRRTFEAGTVVVVEPSRVAGQCFVWTADRPGELWRALRSDVDRVSEPVSVEDLGRDHPPTTTTDAVAAARRLIQLQDRLLATYRMSGRPAAKLLDDITEARQTWNAVRAFVPAKPEPQAHITRVIPTGPAFQWACSCGAGIDHRSGRYASRERALSAAARHVNQNRSY